jgi:hypothetical protein
VQDQWAAEAQRLAALVEGSPGHSSRADRQRLQLAREAQAHAANGRFSVAPLFNDAPNQVGQLVALAGTVRRARRVDVGTSPDGTPSDVARRFGIDHYYELELFTDDSQNNPVTFCVRVLPLGFPLGDNLSEPVHVAGFFFKTWSFKSRGAVSSDARQVAPLLIGRGPVPIEVVPPNASTYAGCFVAALFLLVLAGIWLGGWWLARGDRRVRERSRASRFTLAPGQSLNDLDLDAAQNTTKTE